jgi:NAD(P)-dependent dehydrogenase (short-subunit alcohol dehydrogenase family)
MAQKIRPMSQFLLDGRVAIINGASRGIGTATARAFVAVGAAVAMAARDAGALQALADVGDPTSIQQQVWKPSRWRGRHCEATDWACGRSCASRCLALL